MNVPVVVESSRRNFSRASYVPWFWRNHASWGEPGEQERTEGTKHNGLLVERPFDGRWEGLHAEVDEAVDRWPSYALCTQVDNADLASNLDASVEEPG